MTKIEKVWIDPQIHTIPQRVNYLNYGDGLNRLLGLAEILPAGRCTKRYLLSQVAVHAKRSRSLQEIINSYGGTGNKRIDLELLRNDIYASKNFQLLCTKLGCRGFSFSLHEGIRLPGENIRQDVNFRIALLPDERLFFPPRIRRYLRRVGFNHLWINRYPTLCFALGRITASRCHVFVMQSDIVFKKPSFMRDHFRGWSKILFMSILAVAGRSRTIFLPRAEDIVKCCHPFQRPRLAPECWKVIYDDTAARFGLAPAILEGPVDIQVYEELDSVHVKRMYKRA